MPTVPTMPSPNLAFSKEFLVANGMYIAMIPMGGTENILDGWRITNNDHSGQTWEQIPVNYHLNTEGMMEFLSGIGNPGTMNINVYLAAEMKAIVPPVQDFALRTSGQYWVMIATVSIASGTPVVSLWFASRCNVMQANGFEATEGDQPMTGVLILQLCGAPVRP